MSSPVEKTIVDDGKSNNADSLEEKAVDAAVNASKSNHLPEDVPSPASNKNLSATQAAKNAQILVKEDLGENPSLRNANNDSNGHIDVDNVVPVILAEVPDKGRRTAGPLLVAESETVRPHVAWEPEHRQYHDKVWGIVYLVAWMAFLACGFTLVANAHTRYTFHSVAADGNATEASTFNERTLRVVTDHYQADAQKCCATKATFLATQGDTTSGSIFDVCSELTLEDAGRRRGRRHLQFSTEDEDTTGTLSDSKFEFGDGMFDAFLDAPGITVTLCLLAIFCAILWVVLLKFFATPIVFCTEAAKVAFFLYLFITGIQERTTGAAIVALLCGIGVVVWDIFTYKQLIFAGKILSYAASSFQENLAMFCAFIPILGLYALHAYLFVLFYSKSFEVAEVKHVHECYFEEFCTSGCYFVSPSYTTGMVVYISLAYLWSVLLFYTMRLSIIANIVGSWHFHPEHQPGIARAIINTCTTSMGTLAAASLVQTIAEKLNRMLLTESMWYQCMNPIYWIIMPLYCCFGYFIKMFILMLTKFSVILHVFSGKSWFGSAKKVFSIMKRHFKGGFVTEYASRSVLMLGSYIFSISIYLIAWVWLDKEFHTETFIDVNDETILVIVWLFFALFNIWYPVLGIFLLVVLSRFLSKWEGLDPADWVTPFAATFVGCIAMMFFTYLAGIFLDTVDVLFLCFAIDRDNNVDMSDNEFAKLVQEGVPDVLAKPDLDGTVVENDVDGHFALVQEQPVPFADAQAPMVVVSGVEPIHANSQTTLEAQAVSK